MSHMAAASMSYQLSHASQLDLDAPDFPPAETKPLNPIKLKAMAMKFRHNAQGYAFRRKAALNLDVANMPELDAPLLDSKAEPVSKADPQSALSQVTDSFMSLPVQSIQGPDNVLGLKTIFLHPFCIPLVCVPLGMLSSFLGWGESPTFWLNFLALVPLAKILGDATEELSAAIQNDTATGMLNATFGNAVEVIVAVQAIRGGLLSVVKASLLGSVLSNVLLVLGTALLLGGLSPSERTRGSGHVINALPNSSPPANKQRCVSFEKEQLFAVRAVLISIAMLLFACVGLALPTVFSAMLRNHEHDVLRVSRIGAWILMSTYFASLLFQLVTHRKTLWDEEAKLQEEAAAACDDDDDGDDDEAASLTAPCAVLLMFVITVLVSINSNLLVNTLEGMVLRYGIPENFIGIVMLPIAGNACEHAGAIRFAFQDKPGLAIAIAVGSSTQVALLVVPFSVVVAGFLGQPLDLNFGALNVTVVTLSVLVVLVIFLDGRSNWLKGYILCCLYVFIAVLYWFVPETESSFHGAHGP